MAEVRGVLMGDGDPAVAGERGWKLKAVGEFPVGFGEIS